MVEVETNDLCGVYSPHPKTSVNCSAFSNSYKSTSIALLRAGLLRNSV